MKIPKDYFSNEQAREEIKKRAEDAFLSKTPVVRDSSRDQKDQFYVAKRLQEKVGPAEKPKTKIPLTPPPPPENPFKN